MRKTGAWMMLGCVWVLYMYKGADADAGEAEALKSLMRAVDVSLVLQSNWTGDDPCAGNWVGVECEKGAVYNLILESMGLSGTIPADTLAALSHLRRLSLYNNSLSGPIPQLSGSATSLLALWLHHNNFSGPIPPAFFAHTRRLKKLFLSNNQLTGSIPLSLASITNITNLHLEYNLLSGSLPVFSQDSLKDFNVSFNQLTGPIPATHVMQQRFDSSAYLNNPGLCGPPLSAECIAAAPPAPPSHASPPSDDTQMSPSPSDSEADAGAPLPWDEPSAAMRHDGHARRTAILAVLLLGLLLLV